MTKIDCLRQMQEEQKPWVKHNFGDRPSWMPFFGVIEELGEREDALELHPTVRHEKVVDALADAMIFSLDYCSAMGWNMAVLWDASMTYGHCRVNLLSSLGKVAHAHLKQAQGIRVEENHDAEGRQGMIHFLVHLRMFAVQEKIDLVDETYRVWQKVKLRDWKKDPAHAGEAPE
jgi:hypothetical protein